MGNAYTCFLLALIMFVVTSLLGESANIDTDRLALLSLKAHINNDPQNLLATNWSVTASVCNWSGVTCGSRHNRVTALNISSMGLSGTIPSHLGNLSFLSWLDMSNNDFHGFLPLQLSNLRRLKYLDFGHNNFGGEIPSSFISNLSRMEVLVLSSNNLQGKIPLPIIGNSLLNLRILILAKNLLSGSIPSSINNLSSLQKIDLSGNQLSGEIPEAIGNLSSLSILYLDHNKLSGAIPSSIFNISSLQEVDLERNQLSGSIPLMFCISLSLQVLDLSDNKLSGFMSFDAFNNVSSQLQVIDFGFNNLTGPIPPNMFDHFPKLQWLSLDTNQLSGRIPISLFKCQELIVLSMNINYLEGTLPLEVGNLTRLQTLYIGFNNLGGEIPPQIGKLGNLELLVLNRGKYTGHIPSVIGNLTLLRFLDLSENKLTGTIPLQIGKLQSLEELYLGSNGYLSAAIPHTIFNSSIRRVISLVGNHFSGGLPTTLWLPNIKLFQVAINELSGSIPSFISNFSQIVRLDLAYNLFSGDIPDTFGNLRALQLLGLESNNLTSPGLSFISSLANCKNLSYLAFNQNPLINTELPATIGNLSIQYLFAYDSNILGRIPREIGNLSNLIGLSIKNNQLRGEIPSTMGNLRMLQAIDLGYNKLEGSIPSELCPLDSLSILDLAGNQLSGPIPVCLGQMISLRYLVLGSNRFNSSIPSSLTRLADILQLDLSSNFLSGSLPIDVGKWKVVTDMSFSGNQLSGNIPTGFGDLKDLTKLSLSTNRLQGSVPQSFGDMISLEFLDLSANHLSGQIPRPLEKLLNLKYLNLSFNRLQGEIPNGGTFSNYSIQSFTANEGLCGAAWLKLPPCKTNSQRRSNKIAKLLKYIVPTVSATTILILVIIFLRRKKKASLPTQEDISPLATWRRISYQELRQATGGFCESNLLGTGSFGRVYEGTLSDGMHIAIKVFNMELEGAFKSFDIECEVLRNIRHRNLIKIISTCCNIDFKALVLEFMPNGSLEKWLYSHNHFLDMLQRLNIMIDVASALEYLHHGYATPVVHCDLKPSNVLLESAMSAHLGDFGIAKLLGGEDTIIQTMTLATIGYMAPEYGAEGIVSTRGDVYSFGILLMETFTRKKPTDDMFCGDLSLKSWVEQSLPSDGVIDANLLSNYNSRRKQNLAAKGCAMSVLHLALECSSELPEERIEMKEVVAKLKKIKINFLKDTE